MAEQYVQFPSGNLTLEGVWHLYEEGEVFPAVVVCHPHPLYGGDMDNGLVGAICLELANQGINAFRFNFRGVGNSQGAFGEGIGEQEDLKAAISFIESSKFVDRARIGVCGYSFGAGIVLSVASKRKKLRALAVISPPLFFGSQEWLEDFRGYKFFLGGSEDDLFSPQELCHFVESLPEPHEYEIIQGADHFWFGFEKRVAQKVAAFLTKAFNENR